MFIKKYMKKLNYTAYDSNYMTFWIKQNYGDNKKKKSLVTIVRRKGGDKLEKHRGFLGPLNPSI